MSQHHSQAGENSVTRASARRASAAGIALAALLALGSGLAACGGDDDDAAGTTDAPSSSTATPDTIEAPGTTVPESAPTSEAAAPGGSATDSSDAATDGTTAGTTAEADAALAAGSAPTGDTTPAGSEPDSGPTTTGPACEFAENATFPIQRCNMGPAVAVLQSILQANQYAVSAIDGEFGDETLYAVRAFQEAEGLTVDGLVGAETWTALEVPDSYGDDNNGNGTIEPDEVDLANVGT